MNLSIKIGGVFAEIPNTTSIKYCINSPAFSENAIVGNFSYPISFPNTPINRRIFNFVELDNIYQENTELDCEIYIDGIQFISAIFKITKTNKQIVSGNLINNASDFISKIKNKKLTNLKLYEQTFETVDDKIAWMKDTIHFNYPDRPGVMFPVYNKTNNSKDTSSSIEYGQHINQMFLNSAGELEFVNPIGLNYNFFLIFPYLAYIINQIFQTYNIKLTTNPFENDNELKKLVVLNFIKNGWADSSLDMYPNNFHLRDFIAPIEILPFLNGLNKLFGVSFYFDWKKEEVCSVLIKDILNSSNYIDWTDKVVKQAEKKYEDNKGYFIHQDFKDDSISNKQSDYDTGQKLDVNYSVLKPDDLPNNAAQGEIGYVFADNAYYHYDKLKEDDTQMQWIFLTWNFFGVKEKEADKEIASKVNSTGMFWCDRTTDELDLSIANQTNIWMVPEVGIKVIDNWDTWKLSKTSPRIAFYRGIQKAMDDQGYYTVDYPMGSSGNTDAQGNSIGTLKLQYGGENGLIKNFLDGFLNSLDKQKIFNFEIKFDIVDLLNLDLKKQVKINSNFYLIKKLTLDLPLKNTVKAEMVRI